MKDFKSYTQSGQSGATAASGTGTTNTTAANTGGMNNANSAGNADSAKQNGNLNQTVNMASMLAKAFNGKSEGQILQTIIAQAEQGKRDGTLTNADLDNFYNTLAPLLDGFKRQKLRGIIQKLKSI
ncbi:MAG: hypothetical protein K2J54_04695 [Clostridia bacterium]|nr:hypothetical protein [Clostridia bacterium]MDE7083866.1 hypothetical protein [Clostridia bacterium]